MLVPNPPPVLPEGTSPPLIVCAANRFPDGLVIASPRHLDAIALSTAASLGRSLNHPELEQGFLDQFCNFYNRTDAMTIARTNGQLIPGAVVLEELYSENLY